MLPTSGDDNVQFNILIEATNALKELQYLRTDAVSLQEVFDKVQSKISSVADGLGVSFMAMERQFKETIKMAQQLRDQLALIDDPKLKNQIMQNPLVSKLAGVQSPFAQVADPAGWAEVNAIQREVLKGMMEEVKLAERVAKEMNKQSVEESEIVAKRKEGLALAQQELQAVEREGSAIADQLKNYGQVRRTVQETMEYLRSFAGTQQGGGILTQFLGNYKQSHGVIQQIDSIKSAILGLSKATGASFSQAGQLIKEQFSQIPGITNQVNQAVDQMGKQFETSSKKSVRGVDAIRIALGALVAMLLFSVIQAIQNAFRGFIENLRETELAVYNLINAERRLSELGIDITPKGLQEIIDGVQELVPILSKIDVEELVSRIASNVAPSIKLTREEMEKLAKAVALAYIQNKALGYSFDEIEKSFTESILTGKISQGINKYGVKIDDLIIKQHAVSMELVESVDAFNALDGEMQAHIQSVSLIDYAYQEFSKNAQSIPEYMKTTDAALEVAKTSWSDLLTTIGKFAAPFIVEFLNALIDNLVKMNEWLIKNEATIKQTVITISGLFAGMVKLDEISERGFFDKLDASGNFKEFIQSIKDGMDRARDSGVELGEALDTPTSAINELSDAAEAFDADGFSQKLEDIIEDAANAREDLEKKFGQKQDDIDLEYIRKQADAERDLARKVEDINRDAERDIANLKEKQREDDLRAEEDYQNKLWELRMRYLLNLEDALHARDARQVIRLQREYEIDKEALERKKGMDDKQREEDQSNALEDIEIKRQERLADAQREFQEKLADQRLAKQRELDDLNVWYAREQADLEQSIQRKLEALIKGWIDEKKITEANAAEVYGILLKYFGPGGLTDGLAQYMFTQLGQAAMMLGQIANMMGGAQSPRDIPRSSGGSSGEHTTGGGGRSPRIGGRGMVEGGTLLATRPTNVTFGEAGAEMATFTPLGRVGRNQGKVFGDGSGGGMDGKILVELFLSPDLEARIIDASMDGVGEIITRVTRSKV